MGVIFIFGCSNKINDLKSILKQECKENDPNTQQCEISKSNELTDIEKISSLGILYLFGNEKIKKDYVKSFNLLQVAEHDNDAEAINGLGVIYMLGLGRNKDFRQAEKFFKNASDLGEKNAKNNLGELFRLQKNIELSEYWFNLGIQDNPAKAYEGLSKIYIEQNNFKDAYTYAIKAAKLKNMESEYNLGVFFEQGIYVDKNFDKAIYWYRRAASQGHLDAKNNLSIILKHISETQ